jgi:hypothetical protein
VEWILIKIDIKEFYKIWQQILIMVAVRKMTNTSDADFHEIVCDCRSDTCLGQAL